MVFTILLQNIILGINIQNVMSELISCLNDMFEQLIDQLIMALNIYNIYCVGKLKHLDRRNIYNSQIMMELKNLY
jgi:hypothetical protein